MIDPLTLERLVAALERIATALEIGNKVVEKSGPQPKEPQKRDFIGMPVDIPQRGK